MLWADNRRWCLLPGAEARRYKFSAVTVDAVRLRRRGAAPVPGQGRHEPGLPYQALYDVSFTLSGGRRVEAIVDVPPGGGAVPGRSLPARLRRRSHAVPRAGSLDGGARRRHDDDHDAGRFRSRRAPRRRSGWSRSGRAAVGTVVAARLAVDALQSLPEVDDDRIGLVGWSAGARIGAILAGVDRRIEAFDLLSGGAPPLRDYVANAPAQPEAGGGAVSSAPSTRCGGSRKPGRGTLLLQDGRKGTRSSRRLP